MSVKSTSLLESSTGAEGETEDADSTVSSSCAHERTWNQRYKELLEFYQEKGHCTVPCDYEPNRKLGNWVRTQRAQFKKFQQGVPCTMTAERIELLDNINFPWKIKCDWIMRYKELESYFNCHGDSRIPVNWPQNRSLGRWVDRQRTAYRLHINGKPSTLTKERIKMLEQLNFCWKVRDDWHERYEELCAYYKVHGDSLVPTRSTDYPALAKWVDTQRQQYRLYNRNKSCSMTKERIELLEQVNFQWRRSENWLDRFHDLEEYVKKHGDTLVPQHHSEKPGLGIWVRNQRTQYKLYKQGKPSKLFTNRVKMLKSLNFEWNAYEAKWMCSFVELGKYMREHGLGTLPSYQSNRRLRAWAEEQRRQYRSLQQQTQMDENHERRSSGNSRETYEQLQPASSKCRLTTKRIELLDLVAFPWTSEKQDYVDTSGGSETHASLSSVSQVKDDDSQLTEAQADNNIPSI